MEKIHYCAPGHLFCRTRKILLAVDGSEGSARAATVAFEVAEMTKAKLYILHVIPIPIVKQIAFMSDGDVEDILAKYSTKGELLLEGIKESSKEYGIEVELIIDRGSPSNIILNQVKELGVDLVVMGSIGASGGGRAGFGSSTERVTKNIDIPMLIV